MNTQIIRPPAFQRPSGKLYLFSSQLNLTNDVDTLVELNSKVITFKDGIEDVINHKITPGVAGFYSIFGQVTFYNLVADKGYWSEIWVNGSSIVRSYEHASVDATLSVPVFLNSVWLSDTEYVQLYGKQKSGVDTVDILSGWGNTFLIVQRVR